MEPEEPRPPRPYDPPPVLPSDVDWSEDPIALPPMSRASGTVIVIAIGFMSFMGQMLVVPGYLYSPYTASVLEQFLNTAPIAVLALFAFGLSPRRVLGLRLPDGPTTGIVAGLAPANLLAIGFLMTLILTFVFPPEMVREQLRGLSEAMLVADTPSERAWMLATVVIGAPIAEELFYRGFLQNLLVRWWGARAGILVATVLFTLAHMDATRFPSVFAIGLLLAFVYHRTGSLWASILVHALNNGLATIPFLLFPEAYPVIFGLPGFIVGVPLLLFLLRKLASRPMPTRDEDEPAPVTFNGGRLFLGMIPFWSVLFAAGFGVAFFASDGTKALVSKSGEISETAATIGDRFATDPAWSEFTQIRSACRARIKEGEVEVEDYVDYLENFVEPRTAPLGSLEPDYRAIEPFPEERAVLDELIAEAERRFDADIKPAMPLF